MLSFDVSVIDIPMLIAIAVLYALYLGGTQRERERRKSTARPQIIQRAPSKATVRTERVNHKNSDCPYKLGYLKARKTNNIPEECVACARLVKCLLPDGIIM
jgi:hypothetical protein